MALNGFLEKASGGRRQSVSRSRALHTLPDMLFLLGSQKESFSRDAKSELSWEGQGHPDRKQQQNASKSKHTLKGPLSLFDLRFPTHQTTASSNRPVSNTSGTQVLHHQLPLPAVAFPDPRRAFQDQKYKPPPPAWLCSEPV